MMAVRFLRDGAKLYLVREFATMRDGSIIVKLSDRDGCTLWADASELEVFTA